MSESSNPLGQPSKIGGWTAFGRSTKTPDDADTSKAPSKIPSDSPDLSYMSRRDSSPIRGPTPEPIDSHTDSPKSQGDPEHALSPASGSLLTEEEQKAKDERLLAGNPKFITGAALLDLAERYSTTDIANLANKAQKTEKLTFNHINGRLNTAMESKAKAVNSTRIQIRDELTEKRKAFGIRSTRQNPSAATASPTVVAKNSSSSSTHGQNLNGQAEQAAEAARAADPRILSDADARAKYGADYLIFQQPNGIFRAVILDLATRYSNKDISDGIAALPQNTNLTENGVANRINSALQWRAKATGRDIHQVRAELNEVRVANGVISPNSHGKGYLRAPQAKRKRSVLEPIEEQKEDETSLKAPKVARKGKSSVLEPMKVQEDDEMTEADMDAQQQYDAELTESDGAGSEVQEAEATTLPMEAASPDVIEAASILMGLHRADAALATPSEETRETSPEKQDVEMDDAETADQVARFRDTNGVRSREESLEL